MQLDASSYDQRPVSQSWHDVAPSLLVLPAVQGVHSTVADLAEYLPPAHRSQDGIPWRLWNLPASHPEQAVPPVVAQYVPLLQSVQDGARGAEKVPLEQNVQLVAPAREYLPLTHALHSLLPLRE